LLQLITEIIIILCNIKLKHLYSLTIKCREGTTALRLAEELEGALLSYIALAAEGLNALEADGVLALAYNTTLTSLHKILLGESTGSVLRGSVIYLGLGAYS
jgi:hypothetical protein